MSYSKTRTHKSDANALIFMCWLIYSVSYIGKVNYSANIGGIIDFFDVSKAEAGVPPTFFFFAYGIGQVVNGILCKRYNTKWVIFSSLFISAVINLLVALTVNFGFIKWLWMINGFALSMLWPTLVRLISESMPKKDLGKSSAVMGTTVASGTLVIYGLSALYTLFGSFKLALYTAAIADFTVSVIWLLLYNRAVNKAKREKANKSSELEKQSEARVRTEDTIDTKKLLYITLGILCFCAIAINLIKDGLTTWLPVILKEEYSLSGSISILLTLLLPIVSIFGNLFALKVHKKIPDFVTHCGVIFAIALGFTGIIIGSLLLKMMSFMIVSVVFVNFLVSSLNSVVTSIFPIFMRERVAAGLWAGILNGFCYLGSTLSSYGFGAVADNFGWMMIFWIILAISFVICLICFGYFCFTKRAHRINS